MTKSPTGRLPSAPEPQNIKPFSTPEADSLRRWITSRQRSFLDLDYTDVERRMLVLLEEIRERHQ